MPYFPPASSAGAIQESLLTTRGDIIYRNATVPARLAKGTSGQVLTMGADDPAWATASGVIPYGNLWGLTLSNNGTDAVNDIDVAAGAAVDSTNVRQIVLASAITKRIDAVWAVGSASGGMDTGAVANSTWYAVWLIERSDTGVEDVLFSLSATAPTMPANYDYKRRIGWVRRGVATNLAFTQVENYFTLTTEINDVAVSSTTTAAQATLTAPPSTISRFRAVLQVDDEVDPTTSGYLICVLSEVVQGNITPAVSTGIATLVATAAYSSVAITSHAAQHLDMRVNASSQIEYDFVGVGGTGSNLGDLDISTYGWIDTRGRYA